MRIFLVLGCLACLATIAQAQAPLSDITAVRMSASQIAAHNSALEPTDPTFIKCVRAEAPGSLVQRRVCRTQEDWNSRAEAGQREARDIVDSIQARGSSYPQEPAGSIIPVGSN